MNPDEVSTEMRALQSKVMQKKMEIVLQQQKQMQKQAGT